MKKRTGENHPKHFLRFEIRKTPYIVTSISIYLKSNAQKYEFKN